MAETNSNKKQINIRHGHAVKNKRTPEYSTWLSMIHRCHSPSNSSYATYGAKGITVCERWRKFENFFSDMGLKPAGHSIDRVNNSLGYSPENCRWADAKTQSLNRSATQLIEINGVTKCISEWCKDYGVKNSTVSMRRKKGFPKELWFSKPLKRGGANKIAVT